MENKIKLSKSLVVNKADITRLQESQMSKIKGGYTGTAQTAADSGLSCLAASCVSSCNSGSCNKIS